MHVVPSARTRRTRLGASALAAAALVPAVVFMGGLSGCYERVVRASGPGTSNVQVYEPNLKSDRIPIVDDVEDAIFGRRDGVTGKDAGIRAPSTGVKPPR